MTDEKHEPEASLQKDTPDLSLPPEPSDDAERPVGQKTPVLEPSESQQPAEERGTGEIPPFQGPPQYESPAHESPDYEPTDYEPADYEPTAWEPAAPPSQRLYRRPEGKILAGVCSGLGAYWAVDPVALRIAFVVLTIFTGGLGFIAYLVLWLVMPMARPGQPIVERPLSASGDPNRWVAITVIAIGAVILARGFFSIRGGVFWGLLLIGVGVAVWGRDLTGPRRPPPPATRPPATRPPAATSTARFATSDTAPTTRVPGPATPPTPSSGGVGSAPTTPFGPPAPPAPPGRPGGPGRPGRPTPGQPPKPPKPPREPSILGRLVVGAGALCIGISLLLNNVGVDMTAKMTFAILLALVGVGLLIGTWFGRARWLIAPGWVLVLCLVTVTAVPFTPKGGFGEIGWRPSSLKELESTCRESRGSCYSHTAGQAVLDLSELTFGTRDRRVDVRLGFGELLVLVPDEVPVRAEAHVQGGEIDLFGAVSDGWDIEQEATDRGDAELGTLHIESAVTFGELHIRRGDSSDIPQFLNSGRNNMRFGFDRNDNENDNDANEGDFDIRIGGSP